MSSRSFEFAKRNIKRSPYQAVVASLVCFLTFFALMTFLILAAGSQMTLRFFESKPQVIAFFKEGTTNEDIMALENALQGDKRVTMTKFISQDQALEIYKERNKDEPALLEVVTASILPAALEISTATPEDLGPIAEILRKEQAVDDVEVPEDLIERLTSVTKIIRALGVATVLLLMIFATLVILMIIGFKIRVKRQEIEIMRLLGASPSFIRNPFIIEGMFYGIAGATSAWITSYLLLWYFTPFLQGFLQDVKLLPISPMFMLILLGGTLLSAAVVGYLGAFGAVRRYLRI